MMLHIWLVQSFMSQRKVFCCHVMDREERLHRKRELYTLRRAEETLQEREIKLASTVADDDTTALKLAPFLQSSNFHVMHQPSGTNGGTNYCPQACPTMLKHLSSNYLAKTGFLWCVIQFAD